jgi:hypothetical protein
MEVTVVATGKTAPHGEAGVHPGPCPASISSETALCPSAGPVSATPEFTAEDRTLGLFFAEGSGKTDRVLLGSESKTPDCAFAPAPEPKHTSIANMRAFKRPS